MIKAFFQAYPPSVVATAGLVSSVWVATGYPWYVAVYGAVLTVGLRLSLDKSESPPFCENCPDHEACAQGACHLNGGPLRPALERNCS